MKGNKDIEESKTSRTKFSIQHARRILLFCTLGLGVFALVAQIKSPEFWTFLSLLIMAFGTID